MVAAEEHSVMVLGASYGMLITSKLLAAGHAVTLVCLPEEADLINERGIKVRYPIGDFHYEVSSSDQPGCLCAVEPSEAEPERVDLLILAMQEPHYQNADVSGLISRAARANVPFLSIMNMPPSPYLERFPQIDVDTCARCYSSAGVWKEIGSGSLTHCSADPQAVRDPLGAKNELTVRLPSNFKVATFPDADHNALLMSIAESVNRSSISIENRRHELPVKIRVRSSSFIPLAKWPMLITGNYRCFTSDMRLRTIDQAVNGNSQESRQVYDWVVSLCRKLGAGRGDLVPFAAYAKASRNLKAPSSVARALQGGARKVERVDLLVRTIAAGLGESTDMLDNIVSQVDALLENNRHEVA